MVGPLRHRVRQRPGDPQPAPQRALPAGLLRSGRPSQRRRRRVLIRSASSAATTRRASVSWWRWRSRACWAMWSAGRGAPRAAAAVSVDEHPGGANRAALSADRDRAQRVSRDASLQRAAHRRRLDEPAHLRGSGVRCGGADRAARRSGARVPGDAAVRHASRSSSPLSQTLLADRQRLEQLRVDCRSRLRGHSYRDRLEQVLAIACARAESAAASRRVDELQPMDHIAHRTRNPRMRQIERERAQPLSVHGARHAPRLATSSPRPLPSPHAAT